MSEFTINERRNWKAQVFPYDHFIPDDSQECLYCLTDKQAEILRGIIEPLGWKTRWWSDDDTPIDKNEIEAFRDDLIRRLMMSCCGDEVPVQYRYTSDGVLQRSEDGGSTWTDAPQYDPRNYSPQFPPMSGSDGSDKKCLAATGAADLIKQQVGNQLTDDMSRYTLSQLITDWVKTYIETSNPLQALLTIIANQIFALVIATLRPTLTDTVYDTLKCILYCNIGDDASFNDAQWQAVRDDITSQIGGIAGIFLEHLVYLLGKAGLTNVARAAGATSGDCSGCDCNNCAADPVIPPGGGTLNAQDGCNLNISSAPEGDHYAAYLWFNNHTGTFDATKCGSVAYWNAESGTVTNTGRNDCNTGAYHGGFALGQCGSQFYWAGPAPFTLAIEVAACPP